MNSKYDVAIIGGGVIGVCSAYYLAQKGVKVVLIEKGRSPRVVPTATAG